MELGSLGRWQDRIGRYYPLSPSSPAFAELERNVDAAYRCTEVYPPEEDLFAAFSLTPPESVRCVILGQDPYHEPGQAHGLCFSVRPGTALPKSLQNIYRELSSDLGVPAPKTGCLRSWAEQGVLLLNSVLTVERGRAGSHAKFGWQAFTDAAIASLADLPQPIVSLLWGKWAAEKGPLLSKGCGPRLVLTAPHPSPLSAYRGFFGSRPFSQANSFLTAHGAEPIRWTETDPNRS